MKPFNFSGLMAPVFTPFTDDGKYTLKLEVIPTYLQHLDKSGIKGILVNGTSGEGVAQTVEEREALAEKWIQARAETKGSQCIVVQVGGASFPDVLRLASHAEKIGADGIMCLPDLFFRPNDIDALVDYLALVSSAAPNTPLLYYHIPGFTAVNLSMSALMEKSGKIPTFVGLKFTSSDLQELGKCVDVCTRNPGSFRVFLGCDDLMLAAYALGSESTIATSLNIFPHLAIQLQEHVKSGKNLKEATEIQRKISAIIQSILRGGTLTDWVPTMKAAMNHVTKIDFGPTRPPQRKLSELHVKEMTADLNRLLSK